MLHDTYGDRQRRRHEGAEFEPVLPGLFLLGIVSLSFFFWWPLAVVIWRYWFG